MTDATRDPRIKDLVGYAVTDKPVEFKSTFDAIVADRVAGAVDAKKVELAKGIFGAPTVEVEPQEEEETDGENA